MAVALRWHPADGCLDSAGLYQLVRSRRRPVGSAAEADAIVSGRARMSAAGGWDVELVVADRRGAILGRRSLAVADGGCQALRQHVAVVVAMLVDSSVVEAAADIRAPEKRAPRPPSGARWTGDAALAIVGESGRLPGAVPGLAMSAGLASPGGWRAELAMSAFAIAEASDATGQTSLRWLAAAAAGCPPGLARAGWSLAACGGLEAGAVLARGAGFARNQRDRELMLDGFGRLRIERRVVGRTFAALGVSVRLAIRRPQFGYEDESGRFQPLYAPTWAAATADIGVGAHFP